MDAIAQEEVAPAAAPEPEQVPAAAPLSGSHFELAATGGYLSPPIHGGTTPFGAGFGARFAYAPSAWVVSIGAMGFLGASDLNSENHAWKYGADLGRSFFLSREIVLRPHVGFGGVSVIHTETTTSSSTTTTSRSPRVRSVDVVTQASSSSSSSSSLGNVFGTSSNSTVATAFYVEPGVALLFVTGAVFFGADATMLVLPSIAYGGADAMTWISYGFGGQLGISF